MTKRKTKHRWWRKSNVKPVTELDESQREEIAKTFTYSGRLLRDLFEKFVYPRCHTVLVQGTGFVLTEDIPHARVVANIVAGWATDEIFRITGGARMPVGVNLHRWHSKYTVFHGEGFELELVFPPVFSPIFVAKTINESGMVLGKAHCNGTLDDIHYCEIARNLITAENGNHDERQITDAPAAQRHRESEQRFAEAFSNCRERARGDDN